MSEAKDRSTLEQKGHTFSFHIEDRTMHKKKKAASAGFKRICPRTLRRIAVQVSSDDTE
jgi:hypothetical protein